MFAVFVDSREVSRSLRRLSGITATVCVLLCSIASAATTTFTSRSSFQSSLPAGNYFNNFSGVPDAFNSPVSTVTGTGGTPSIGYTIAAPTSGLGVFPDSGFKAVGNWNQSQDVVVTFNTGNVFSAGGDVWLSDINGTRLAGSLTVNFSDGSSVAVPSTTSGSFGFAGITTDGGPLTSMTIVNNPGGYLNFSNFSTAVPEPSTLAAVAGGLAGIGCMVVRGRRRRGPRG